GGEVFAGWCGWRWLPPKATSLLEKLYRVSIAILLNRDIAPLLPPPPRRGKEEARRLQSHSLFKQPRDVDLAKLPRPVSFSLRGRVRRLSPLRMRGDGAPGGAAVVGSVSAPPCEDAEAPPGAPPEQFFSLPGLICGRLRSASPTVVNGRPVPGRAFRVRAV